MGKYVSLVGVSIYIYKQTKVIDPETGWAAQVRLDSTQLKITTELIFVSTLIIYVLPMLVL